VKDWQPELRRLLRRVLTPRRDSGRALLAAGRQLRHPKRALATVLGASNPSRDKKGCDSCTIKPSICCLSPQSCQERCVFRSSQVAFTVRAILAEIADCVAEALLCTAWCYALRTGEEVTAPLIALQ